MEEYNEGEMYGYFLKIIPVKYMRSVLFIVVKILKRNTNIFILWFPFIKL